MSEFLLEDLNLVMESSFLNFWLNTFHSLAVKAAQKAITVATDYFDSFVQGLDLKLKNANSTTFMVSVFDKNFPLNLTMTEAPKFDKADDLINFSFDGTFFDKKMQVNHVSENTVLPYRHADGQSEQIWIHQSMLGSLFYGIVEEVMPYEVNDTAGASTFKKLFHEISTHYGEDVVLDLELVLGAKSGDFLTLDKTRGMVIGERENATIAMMVYAENATTKKELAIQFEMDLDMIVNASMSNLYVYLNIPTIKVQDVKITHDKVGLYDRNYDDLLNILMGQIISNINTEWTTPYDMRVLSPEVLPFLANMFLLLELTPFSDDQFLFLGFTYFVDNMMLSQTQLFAHTETYQKTEHSNLQNIKDAFHYLKK
jgi:hypothetical protein